MTKVEATLKKHLTPYISGRGGSPEDFQWGWIAELVLEAAKEDLSSEPPE